MRLGEPGPTRAGLCDVWSAILQDLSACDDKVSSRFRDRTDPRSCSTASFPDCSTNSAVRRTGIGTGGLDAVVDRAPRSR